MAGVPVATEGWANTKYAPSHVEVAVAASKPKGASGAAAFVETTGSFRGHYRNLPAVGDYDEYDVALAAGTWELALEGYVGASLGRVAVSLDGAQVGIIDQWTAGSTLAARLTLPAITVRQGGVHTLRLTVAAKNPSSAGTAVRLAHVSLTRANPSAVPDPFAWTYKAASFTPRSVGVDGLTYGNGGIGDRLLRRTSDGGATFADGQDFGALVNSGEYVISVLRTTAGYVVVTSSDASVAGNYARVWFSTSWTSGFTAVQALNGTNEFSLSRPEIGPNGQTWLALGEYSTDMPQPAHRLWHSSDGGQTWRVIKTAVVTDSTKNSHFHGCAHDPSAVTGAGMRLYSSQGDNGNDTFAYTDNPQDPTPTWTVVPFVDPHPQPTTVGVFPGQRLFISGDGLGNAGITTLPVSTLVPEEKLQTPLKEVATQQFGRSPYAQSGDGRAVVVVPDRLGGTLKSYFLATGDYGKTWHVIHTMDLASLGSGSNGVVGPDAAGWIYYKAPLTNPAPASDNLLVAPMPTFRVVT